jgi:hypothetical protein
MRALFYMALALLFTLRSACGQVRLESLSPHFSTNALIAWAVPTNNVPKELRRYEQILPRIFSEEIISNAIVLASLQSKGFPPPSTNTTCFIADEDINCPCGHPCIFSIDPGSATLSYTVRHPDWASHGDIPSDESTIARAVDCATELGLDASQLISENVTSCLCSFDENGRKYATPQICGRRVFLSRRLDGIGFFDLHDSGWNQGLSFGVGSHGTIRSFFLDWTDLIPKEPAQTATPEEIIACIRAFKTILWPVNETNHLERLKVFGNARKLTVTRITPYYNEGVYGETPPDGQSERLITPFADLEAVADFGNSNATLQLIVPILSDDVYRLLNRRQP